MVTVCASSDTLDLLPEDLPLASFGEMKLIQRRKMTKILLFCARLLMCRLLAQNKCISTPWGSCGKGQVFPIDVEVRGAACSTRVLIALPDLFPSASAAVKQGKYS